MREEYISPSRGHEVICVLLSSDHNQTFNSSPLQGDGSINLEDVNLDDSTKQALSENKVKVEEFAKRVGRIHTCGLPGPGSQASCGVVFAVAPGKLRVSYIHLPSILICYRFIDDLSTYFRPPASSKHQSHI